MEGLIGILGLLFLGLLFLGLVLGYLRGVEKERRRI